MALMTWPLTSDGAGAVTFTANDWRTIVTNLFTEGILGASSFEVTERALGANMTLDITAGVAVLEGDDSADQGRYMVREDAATLSAVTISTADASNPRIDLVGIQLRDPSEGGAAGRNCVFAVTAGTPAASPVAPTAPDSFLTLASVLVPASATSIDDGDITDLRAHATLTHDVVDDANATLLGTANLVNSTVMRRNQDGVVAVATPTSAAHAATKGYVDGLFPTSSIADDAVTTAKILNAAVTTVKLGASSVTSAKIADGHVLTAAIADEAVTAAKIAAPSSGTLASGTVTYVKIMGWVFVHGNGTAESNTLATLPSGFRPTEQVAYPMVNDFSTPSIDRVFIATTGVIDTLPPSGSSGAVRRWVAFFPAA